MIIFDTNYPTSLAQDCILYMQRTASVNPDVVNGDLYYYRTFGNPNGSICFYPDENAWEFDDTDPDELITIVIRKNGSIEFWHHQDDFEYLSTFISHPQELPEIFDFFSTAKENDLQNNFTEHQIRVSAIIDSVFITIPDNTNKSIKLFNLNRLGQLPDDIRSTIIKLLNEDMDEWVNTGNWANHIQNHGLLKHFDSLEEPGERDIVLSDLSPLAAHNFDSVNCGSHIILRISQSHSLLYFLDFLKYTVEGEKILKQLGKLKNGDPIPKKLLVSFPKRKNIQIRKSIELRHHIKTFRELCDRLITMRDPIENVVALYKRRIASISLLYNESLHEIYEMSNPLPSMIEQPYRLFRRAEPTTKQNESRRLLNLLIRIPLYFLLEDLSVHSSELAKPFLDRLYSQTKLTDGEYAAILTDLSKVINQHNAAHLYIFTELSNTIDREYLSLVDELVSKRNRCTHEPFDCETFIKACIEFFPKMVDKLRNALTEIRILKVKSLNVSNGKGLVEAFSLSGADTSYDSIIMETDEDLRKFPKDHIIAYHIKQQRGLPLAQFFNVDIKPASRISLQLFSGYSETFGPTYIDIFD